MGASEPTLVPFTVRGTQLLSAGQSMDQLARTSELWVHAKVYAEGGENGLHAHAREHHMFMVLNGQARFFDASGGSMVLSPYDGVVIPPGVAYKFQSVADENLVLLRVGTGAVGAREGDEEASSDLPAAMMVRVGPDGEERPPTAPENLTGAYAAVPAAGARFGAPEERSNG